MKPVKPTQAALFLVAVAGLVLVGWVVWRSPRSGAAKNQAQQFPTNAVAAKDIPKTAAPVSSSRTTEILSKLDGGGDAPTGRGFKIGRDGRLSEAPTQRVALLDELARLDPQAGAAAAAKILKRFTTPDEWAVALRNYALADNTPAGRAFLEQKLREMLTNEAWQQNPSAGFLEAFDVAVHLGGTNLMPVLAEFVRRTDEGNRATAHAAYLTLDRLVINDPVTALQFLETDAEAMSGRAETRANYFARADVADPQQRALVEKYLLSTERTAAELRTFAGLFPNANFMISDNLLTRCETPDGASLAHRDRAALQTVEEWLKDPRFAGLQAPLQAMKARLQQFVPGGTRP